MKINQDLIYEEVKKPLSEKCIYFIFSNNLSKQSKEFLEEIMTCFPNPCKLISVSENVSLELRNYRYIKVHEEIQRPTYLIINLPANRIVFKIINYTLRKDMNIREPYLSSKFNMFLKNFNSDLGVKVATQLMEFYDKIDPTSHQAVNFTVHKDFLFFRLFRYKIRVSSSVVGKSDVLYDELGPKITLRLWRMTEVVDGVEKISNYNKYVKNIDLL